MLKEKSKVKKALSALIAMVMASSSMLAVIPMSAGAENGTTPDYMQEKYLIGQSDCEGTSLNALFPNRFLGVELNDKASVEARKASALAKLTDETQIANVTAAYDRAIAALEGRGKVLGNFGNNSADLRRKMTYANGDGILTFSFDKYMDDGTNESAELSYYSNSEGTRTTLFSTKFDAANNLSQWRLPESKFPTSSTGGEWKHYDVVLDMVDNQFKFLCDDEIIYQGAYTIDNFYGLIFKTMNNNWSTNQEGTTANLMFYDNFEIYWAPVEKELPEEPEVETPDYKQDKYVIAQTDFESATHNNTLWDGQFADANTMDKSALEQAKATKLSGLTDAAEIAEVTEFYDRGIAALEGRGKVLATSNYTTARLLKNFGYKNGEGIFTFSYDKYMDDGVIANEETITSETGDYITLYNSKHDGTNSQYRVLGGKAFPTASNGGTWKTYDVVIDMVNNHFKLCCDNEVIYQTPYYLDNIKYIYFKFMNFNYINNKDGNPEKWMFIDNMKFYWMPTEDVMADDPIAQYKLPENRILQTFGLRNSQVSGLPEEVYDENAWDKIEGTNAVATEDSEHDRYYTPPGGNLFLRKYFDTPLKGGKGTFVFSFDQRMKPGTKNTTLRLSLSNSAGKSVMPFSVRYNGILQPNQGVMRCGDYSEKPWNAGTDANDYIGNATGEWKHYDFVVDTINNKSYLYVDGVQEVVRENVKIEDIAAINLNTKHDGTGEVATDWGLDNYSLYWTYEPEFSVEDMKITKTVNGVETEVTDISQVAVGDVLTFKADLYNYSGDDVDYMISYAVYNGNRMTMMDFEEDTIVNKTVSKPVTFTYTVTDTTNLKLKMFMWDGLETMKPNPNVTPLVIG